MLKRPLGSLNNARKDLNNDQRGDLEAGIDRKHGNCSRSYCCQTLSCLLHTIHCRRWMRIPWPWAGRIDPPGSQSTVRFRCLSCIFLVRRPSIPHQTTCLLEHNHSLAMQSVPFASCPFPQGRQYRCWDPSHLCIFRPDTRYTLCLGQSSQHCKRRVDCLLDYLNR